MKLTERNAEICRLVSDGELLIEVAKGYGISVERVRQICEAGKVFFRKSVRAAKVRAAIKDIEKSKIIEREKALCEKVRYGISIRAAGEELGFTRSQIERLARKYGLGEVTMFRKHWNPIKRRRRKSAAGRAALAQQEGRE